MSDPTTQPKFLPYEERCEVEDFILTEARYADESRYDDWEALLEDDMIYWVPRGVGDFDPNRDISIINDNRSRVATRIRQLKTGTRHSQTPVSPMSRIISNIVITRLSDSEYKVNANFVLHEIAVQSTETMKIMPGRVEYHIRRRENGFGMFYKKITLINGASAVPTIAYLI